jgi:hypothetical protein
MPTYPVSFGGVRQYGVSALAVFLLACGVTKARVGSAEVQIVRAVEDHAAARDANQRVFRLDVWTRSHSQTGQWIAFLCGGTSDGIEGAHSLLHIALDGDFAQNGVGQSYYLSGEVIGTDGVEGCAHLYPMPPGGQVVLAGIELASVAGTVAAVCVGKDVIVLPEDGGPKVPLAPDRTPENSIRLVDQRTNVSESIAGSSGFTLSEASCVELTLRAE